MRRLRLARLATLALLTVSCGLASQPARARTTGYSYDALGRLTKVAYDNGVTVTYAYDSAGNRTARTVVTGPNSGGPTRVIVLPMGGYFVLPLR